MFDGVELIFAALELVFVGAKLVFEAVEHKILRYKKSFYCQFHQINQPNFDKKQLSFRLKLPGDKMFEDGWKYKCGLYFKIDMPFP